MLENLKHDRRIAAASNDAVLQHAYALDLDLHRVPALEHLRRGGGERVEKRLM